MSSSTISTRLPWKTESAVRSRAQQLARRLRQLGPPCRCRYSAVSSISRSGERTALAMIGSASAVERARSSVPSGSGRVDDDRQLAQRAVGAAASSSATARHCRRRPAGRRSRRRPRAAPRARSRRAHAARRRRRRSSMSRRVVGSSSVPSCTTTRRLTRARSAKPASASTAPATASAAPGFVDVAGGAGAQRGEAPGARPGDEHGLVARLGMLLELAQQDVAAAVARRRQHRLGAVLARQRQAERRAAARPGRGSPRSRAASIASCASSGSWATTSSTRSPVAIAARSSSHAVEGQQRRDVLRRRPASRPARGAGGGSARLGAGLGRARGQRAARA